MREVKNCLVKVAKICAMSTEGWNEVMDQMEWNTLNFPTAYILFQDPFHKESCTCFPWWEKSLEKTMFVL